MSLVTLDKFLNSSRWDVKASVRGEEKDVYLEVVTRALGAIRQSVLCGEAFTDLFSEVDSIRKELHVKAGAEVASRCAQRLDEALATYQSRYRQLDIDRATDLRNVLDMLNESLSYLTSDVETSERRRRELEQSLSTASRLDDLTHIRKHLTKMLQVVREEAKADHGKAEKVIKSLGRQIQQIHRAQLRFSSVLRSRTDAVEYIASIMDAGAAATHLHLALFVADSLTVIRERHGDEAASLILQNMGHKQVQALAPEGQVFYWSTNSLLMVWEHTDGSKPAGEVASTLKSPVEQRVFVGSRVAIFNVAVRSLVIQARGTVDDLVGSLDRFQRRGGAC